MGSARPVLDLADEAKSLRARVPATDHGFPRLSAGMVFISEAELRRYKRLATWGVAAVFGIGIGLVIGLVQAGATLVDRFGR